jgi:replicative superfamily II helicase
VAVVDEAHMAEEEEGGRGPAYERLLAKLRWGQRRAELSGTRCVVSATLPHCRYPA